VAILAAIGALALAAGCGSESHPNQPRPPLAAEVTVNITDSTISAEPATVGIKSSNDANLTGNQGKQPNADPKAPLVVNFTIVNSTNTDTTLEIHGGGLRKSSGLLVARGNNVFKIELPTGHYTLEAADLPAATPAPFTVGTKRISSQNDLLLP
jgi:FtsP/CotA-like multicopper oxidase with cupredoxin domain